jgi:hypothetical protein
MKMEKIVVQICENFGSDNINGHNKTIH